jgi:signal transduction histidine kinase
MKSMTKILIRYVFSAAGVACILVAINVIIFLSYIGSGLSKTDDAFISSIADSLVETDGKYSLTEEGTAQYKKSYEWAMLLDEDGDVIWSLDLPSEIKTSYTAAEVAGFSKWYLNDYPVTVWQKNNNLFVLASAKDSIWKHSIEAPFDFVKKGVGSIPKVLIFNIILSIMIALLFGLRLWFSIKPVTQGIVEMAEKKPVTLSTKGMLGEIASKINQTSNELIDQQNKLESRDNARTAWIAGVSHDIRTPLSMVMGYASQLENCEDIAMEQREQAAIIRRQSEKIKQLVNNLNMASKLEYGMQQVNRTKIYPAEILRKLVADFYNNGLEDKYSILLDINSNINKYTCNGDDALLARAFENIIRNSIVHNEQGCEIIITMNSNNNMCEISITDNGTGFDKSVIDNFDSIENTTRLNSHGLGLLIVRKIIMLHQGQVQIGNEIDGGARVNIKL